MVCVIQLFLTVSIVTLKEQLNFPTGPSFAPPPLLGVDCFIFLGNWLVHILDEINTKGSTMKSITSIHSKITVR